MREQYESPETRSDLLRQYLKKVRFKGMSRMQKYSVTFREIERQISTTAMAL